MNNRLYVGNLSCETTGEALRARFGEFGEITDSHIVTDRESGRARGYAFVTMATAADAASAVSGLDGAMLDGRAMRVNVAEPWTARAGSRDPRGGHRGW